MRQLLLTKILNGVEFSSFVFSLWMTQVKTTGRNVLVSQKSCSLCKRSWRFYFIRNERQNRRLCESQTNNKSTITPELKQILTLEVVDQLFLEHMDHC